MTTIQSKSARPALQTQQGTTLDELEKYKLLVSAVQDYAIFFMDKDGYIRTWNKGAERIKGYTPDDIIGKHFSLFFVPEDIARHKPQKELEIATRRGRVEDEDWRVRKDGSRFWASVVITALRDNDGELVGFAKVTRDLTERKQYEDDLQRANALLLAQQQELELLNQSKDEFISLASHQLRTPASAIKQILGMFVEGFIADVDPSHLTLIQKAYDNNERQIDIVNSLLKVAQVDAGKVVLHMEKCPVRWLLESVIEDFQDVITERQQVVTLHMHDPKATVVADKQHLRMAIENIVSNASKYTPATGSIAISTVSADGLVSIAIADSGVGIAKKDLGLLFEKFSRIPNALSMQVGGSGLGLYWANKVIGLHGGNIGVASRVGKGTTFTVSLPAEL